MEKETISIKDFAKFTNKTEQGIYQAINRKSEKYIKYLVIDENGNKRFNKEILKEFEEKHAETQEEESGSGKNPASNSEEYKDLIKFLQNEIELKNKQIENLTNLLSTQQVLLDQQQRLALTDKQVYLLDKENSNKENKKGFMNKFIHLFKKDTEEKQEITENKDNV